MHRVLVGVFALVLSFALSAIGVMLVPRSAHACGNAVLSTAESTRRVIEAEKALDEGDVATARELAGSVLNDDEGADTSFRERTLHVYALSFVRDPSATTTQLEAAAKTLEGHLARNRERGPKLVADLGEAYERLGRDSDAYRALEPLARRDLMGSAYAYAALGRAAEKKGDRELAALARSRCETMASRPGMCRGEYPRPPLLRGKPLGYLLPGIVILVGYHRHRSARRSGAPWTAFKTPAVLTLLAIVAVLAFVAARTPALSTAIAVAGVVFALDAQRRAFVRAVRAGSVPGFTLRPAEPGDGVAPLAKILFAPPEEMTLERSSVDPSYRESARRPLYRFVGRKVKRSVWIVLALLFFVLGLVVLATPLAMRARKSAPAPATTIDFQF